MHLVKSMKAVGQRKVPFLKNMERNDVRLIEARTKYCSKYNVHIAKPKLRHTLANEHAVNDAVPSSLLNSIHLYKL